MSNPHGTHEGIVPDEAKIQPHSRRADTGLIRELQNGAFLYSPEAPTHDADALLSRTIIRSEGEDSMMRQRFAQTPLAPNRIMDFTEPYPESIKTELLRLVSSAVERTGLPDPFASALELEVIAEHDRRIDGNTDAAIRLQNHLQGQRISDDEAALIWRFRTADATLAETAELLLRYPIMGTVEAAKYTDPFAVNAKAKMDMHIQKGLSDFVRQIGDFSKLNFHAYSNHDPRRRKRFMKFQESDNPDIRVLQRLVVGVKDNIAEVTNGRTSVQLVGKHTMMVLPPELALKNTVPIAMEIAGHKVNVQPIALSCYWRLTPQHQ